MYNTLIFDLDGTLVDSIEDLALSTNILMEENHFPTYDLDTYKQFVGNGVDKLIERALPEKYKKDVRKYRARFDEIYKENCLKHTKPYSGIKELIDELYHQGYKLAVVTNKPKINAVTIVNHLFPGKFMYVFGNTVYQPKKPHPCLVQLAMQLMESNKNETLMIGDSNVDIETAINAKIKSVGCEWGFRGKEELVQAGATYTVSKPSDIKDILK